MRSCLRENKHEMVKQMTAPHVPDMRDAGEELRQKHPQLLTELYAFRIMCETYEALLDSEINTSPEALDRVVRANIRVYLEDLEQNVSTELVLPVIMRDAVQIIMHLDTIGGRITTTSVKIH